MLSSSQWIKDACKKPSTTHTRQSVSNQPSQKQQIDQIASHFQAVRLQAKASFAKNLNLDQTWLYIREDF